MLLPSPSHFCNLLSKGLFHLLRKILQLFLPVLILSAFDFTKKIEETRQESPYNFHCLPFLSSFIHRPRASLSGFFLSLTAIPFLLVGYTSSSQSPGWSVRGLSPQTPPSLSYLSHSQWLPLVPMSLNICRQILLSFMFPFRHPLWIPDRYIQMSPWCFCIMHV